MKFVLSILFRNEDLFINLELSQNQYKFVVMCLFQIISEGKFFKDEDDQKSCMSVVDNFMTKFKTDLEQKSIRGLQTDAVSWMMMDEF